MSIASSLVPARARRRQQALRTWYRASPKPARIILGVALFAMPPIGLTAALIYLAHANRWLAPVLGLVMLAASWGAVLDGMPREIIRNFRTKSAPKTLRRFLIWGFTAYLMRTAYSQSIGEILIAAAALPGAIGAYILLIQQRLYARPNAGLHTVMVGVEPSVRTDGTPCMTLTVDAGTPGSRVRGIPLQVRPGESFLVIECRSGGVGQPDEVNYWFPKEELRLPDA